MNLEIKQKMAAIGAVAETGTSLHCTKSVGRGVVFIQDKSYPLYAYTGPDKKTIRCIFGEEGFPFIFGVKEGLHRDLDDIHWNIVREGQIWFQFVEKKG